MLYKILMGKIKNKNVKQMVSIMRTNTKISINSIIIANFNLCFVNMLGYIYLDEIIRIFIFNYVQLNSLLKLDCN